MTAIATGFGERGDEPAVSLKTWIAVGGGLLGAFLAVLNIQITNASLPYIEGGIGTGGVYGTWISTAYLIGEIIVIPLTSFLSQVFSLRRTNCVASASNSSWICPTIASIAFSSVTIPSVPPNSSTTKAKCDFRSRNRCNNRSSRAVSGTQISLRASGNKSAAVLPRSRKAYRSLM